MWASDYGIDFKQQFCRYGGWDKFYADSLKFKNVPKWEKKKKVERSYEIELEKKTLEVNSALATLTQSS